jgi:hypothetical protein
MGSSYEINDSIRDELGCWDHILRAAAELAILAA